jgi:hypothetical protein
LEELRCKGMMGQVESQDLDLACFFALMIPLTGGFLGFLG